MLKLKLQNLATWCKELTTRKYPDAGKGWGQEEKGATEDEMVGWHHWFNGHEFDQTPGESEEQGSLACCSPEFQRVRHNRVTEEQQLELRASQAALVMKNLRVDTGDTGSIIGSGRSPVGGKCRKVAHPQPFRTRDRFHGKHFFHRSGVGMVSGWCKCIIFIVLLLLLSRFSRVQLGATP